MRWLEQEVRGQEAQERTDLGVQGIVFGGGQLHANRLLGLQGEECRLERTEIRTAL